MNKKDESNEAKKVSWGFGHEAVIKNAIRRNPYIASMRKKIAQKKWKEKVTSKGNITDPFVLH